MKKLLLSVGLRRYTYDFYTVNHSSFSPAGFIVAPVTTTSSSVTEHYTDLIFKVGVEF